MPSGVESIGENAFYGCSGITKMTLPAKLTSIGDQAFTSCRNLVELTFLGVTPPEIDSRAFLGVPNENSRAVYYPSTAAALYKTTLDDNNNLSEWARNPVVTGMGYTFNIATGALTVTTKNGSTAWRSDENIATVAEDRFKAIISVVVIEGVTEIENFAFYNCANLVTVSLPDTLTTIEQLAFNGCTNLTMTELPSGVTSIGKNAFFGCSSINKMTLPAGLASIGEKAFINCTSLSEMTFFGATPPATVAADAFSGIGSTGTLYCPTGAAAAYGVFKNAYLPSGWTVYGVSLYTITYNANGGTGTMSPSTAYSGIEFTLPACTFTPPDGKQFKQWAIGNVSTGVKSQRGRRIYLHREYKRLRRLGIPAFRGRR